MFYVMKQDRVIEWPTSEEKGPTMHYITVPAGAIFEAADTNGPVGVTYKGHSIVISQDYLLRLNDKMELIEYLGKLKEEL